MSTISSTNGTSSASSGALFDASAKNQALGKDAFLKLLVARIAHQNPLKPMDDTAYVAQLAQFSSLEQQSTSNKMLELIATQQQGLANTQALNLVGKDVTVRGGSVTLGGDGVGVVAPFKLGDAADKVQVVVRDAEGNVVRRTDLGAQQAGRIEAYRWDGRSDSGVSMPAGRYSVSVEATRGDKPVPVEQEATGRVKAVSFEGGVTKLILDSGLAVSASDLVRVQS